MYDVLAMFLNYWNYFEIQKQLLNLAFVSSEELWRSRRVLSTLAFATSVDNTLLDLHNSSDTHGLIQ